MFSKDYDVFIAYHGSYEGGGSKVTSDQLYQYLVGKKLKVFYYPASQRDVYKANIIDVMRSKTFILVCNEALHLLDNNRIDQSYHYELSTEIDAFYALTQFGNDVSVQDSKIFVCGDYYDKRKKGQESSFHELFANRTHYFCDENNLEASFSTIYDWIVSRLDARATFDSWQNLQTSSEVKEVFGKRSSMSQKCNLPELVASAKNIKCLGISNSELTAKMDPEAIKFSINHGADVEIMFLDPDGTYTDMREKEEGVRSGRIRNITLNNIENALDIKNELPDELKEKYRLYKYDLQPRLNIIILDTCIILQYYANSVPGLSNPCFLIEQQNVSPLYDFCLAVYEEIKKNAIEITEEA
ncbi:MAG: hypothetical protein PHC56_01695 [Herbinix sp.]|nr:hypothetical protein [Herbinix sp.]